MEESQPKAQSSMLPEISYVRPLRDPKREQAAQMLAEDVLTDGEIGGKLGVSDRRVRQWKQEAAFLHRLDFLRQSFAERALRHGIARRDKRVQSAQDDYERLGRVIEARAGDPVFKRVTGGETGAMVLTGYETTYLPKKRTTVDAEGNVREEEYLQKQSAPLFAVDTALFKARQDIRDEIGRELGQIPNAMPPGAALGEVKFTVIYGDQEGGPKVGISASIAPAGVHNPSQAAARETIGGFKILREEADHQGWPARREDGHSGDNGGGGIPQG
jgi:hypothetical protein